MVKEQREKCYRTDGGDWNYRISNPIQTPRKKKFGTAKRLKGLVN
jgi:hypothetical protein